MLCGEGDKNPLPLLFRSDGQGILEGLKGKGEMGFARKPEAQERKIPMSKTSGIRSHTPLPPMLGSNADEKQLCPAAVEACNRQKTVRPTGAGLTNEHSQIGGYLTPGGPRPTDGSYAPEIIAPAKRRMGTVQPPGHHQKPAGHQPGGHLAVRVHFHRSAIKPAPSRLPALQPQKQGADHRRHRILMIRNQLDRQQRKGGPPPYAFEPDNRDPLLPVCREKINGPSLVKGNLLIASFTPTNRADLSHVSEKIDPARKKCTFVFPDALESVTVRYLNCSAISSRGGGTFGHQTFRPAPL